MSTYTDEQMLDATRDVVFTLSHDLAVTGNVAPEITNRIIRIAIAECPDVLPLGNAFVGRAEHQQQKEALRNRVYEAYRDRYGMGVIATIIVSAIVQQVVAAIIRRWWQNEGGFRDRFRLARQVLREK